MQPSKFKSTEVHPKPPQGGDATLKHGSDFILPPPFTYEQADVTAPVVFIGYGVTSTELKRDDLAGLDLKGKIVVMLGGRPKGVDEAAWEKASSPRTKVVNLFGRGIGGLLVANFGSEKQPYSVVANYLSRRQVSLASEPEIPFKLPPHSPLRATPR